MAEGKHFVRSIRGETRHPDGAPLRVIAQVQGEGHARRRAEFPVDPVQVDLDGTLTDVEPLGDLRVAQAIGHQRRQFGLATGQ